MHIFWENSNWPGAHIEPAINCLSWIDSPDDNKPDQGLLAAGSESGSVGITHTYLLPEEEDDMKRYNFNLRGHHSPISMVAWNRNYSKLASCDNNGIIYVWVPNEERYSVEIINQRGVRVQELCWAPDGNAITIIYDDLVLVGGANGQRIWSNSFPETVRSGAWAYNSRELILGVGNKIQVFSNQGAVIFPERTISQNSIIKKIASSSLREFDKKWTIAICDESEKIYLINSYDDLFPHKWKCDEAILDMKWDGSGIHLGVMCTNNKFFILDYMGRVLYSRKIIIPQPPPVLGLSKYDSEKEKKRTMLKTFTWAHNDNVIILAAGGSLAVGHVWKTIPKLSTLVTYEIWKSLGKSSKNVNQLVLPTSVKTTICSLDHHIIKCRIPTPEELCAAICEPKNYMNYCSIIFDSKKRHFYLAIEHLGGNFAILKGKQVNRLIPKFVISIPPHLSKHFQNNSLKKSANDPFTFYDKQMGNIFDFVNEANNNTKSNLNNGSSAQVEDLAAFRRDSNQRYSVWRRSKRQLRALMLKHFQNFSRDENNTLKKSHYPHELKNAESVLKKKKKSKHIILNISANIICTKFQISASQHSYVSNYLPTFLGYVNFKTSVLHLQPRQMTVHLSDLTTLTSNCKEKGVNFAECSQNIVNMDDPITEHPINETEPAFELMSDEISMYLEIYKEFYNLRKVVIDYVESLEKNLINSKKVETLFYNKPCSIDSTSYIVDQSINLQQYPMNNSTTSTESWHNVVDSFEYIDDDDNVNDNIPLIGERSINNLDITLTDNSLLSSKQIEEVQIIKEKLAKLYEFLNDSTEHIEYEKILSSNKNILYNSQITNEYRKDILNISKKVDFIREFIYSTQFENRDIEHDFENGLSGLTKILNNFPITINDIESSTKASLTSTIIPKKVPLKKSKLKLSNIKTIFKQKSYPDIGSRLLDAQQLIDELPNHRTASNRIVPTTSAIEPLPHLLVMTNKAPFWNEQSQVYQLDFGGRVTQESAKNFQIEYKDKQVMQFGRIEGGAYTLDFCSPFSAVQAFAIALASITQRLK
ncbi:Tubby, C-terminal domain and WD40 repeat and WD40/YVTN repeat-like-containing domain and WD40-repeat-containing domain and Tubby C-terminal-like domain-containing protein [Strongyloides ratti]|uniref:Tubby, C-terminal domain and WD40 repeat and WD40/YVTN repeat-like-containing domain and WD40-repeat-containing domain and Tubby C-terminal-like domain-containing protein n=1 Tax=Strongyloides ratti TaxID=34506 RepID=A0A090LI54_STRRB|nr:Tubby, C-terminal domain and WD40 repeat and WD40/YVTN repeat-like-containing domain and WD40-repeat-containing domain and Tubby C-terminal-like domain-containing protein [Strongyloides ratti]CEF67813.1 Tubby, C-terminal domain and WD40 repeat and WD40/YVTN repeat-like-containing domain and WD40-repeat-containing domain and Tubby C-terminal-like domain-containing protein [Strongyloides ratti]